MVELPGPESPHSNWQAACVRRKRMSMSGQKDNWGEKRVSKRLEVALPMLVRGVDLNGIKFEDTAESYNVSRDGAIFLTTRELKLGQKLALIIPGRGPGGHSDFETSGEIRRVIERDKHQWEIGLKFTGRRLRTYMSESN